MGTGRVVSSKPLAIVWTGLLFLWLFVLSIYPDPTTRMYGFAVELAIGALLLWYFAYKAPWGYGRARRP